MSITLEVPKNQTSPRHFHFYLSFFLVWSLIITPFAFFCFPQTSREQTNNTDPKNKSGLNLIFPNRKFNQPKRVTESICAKKHGHFRKNLSQDIRRKNSCSLFVLILPLLLLPISFPFLSFFEAIFCSLGVFCGLVILFLLLLLRGCFFLLFSHFSSCS